MVSLESSWRDLQDDIMLHRPDLEREKNARMICSVNKEFDKEFIFLTKSAWCSIVMKRYRNFTTRFRLLTAYQNIWHACVSFDFSVRKDEMFVFPSGMLIFQPLRPYSMLKTTRRFFQSGKISGVFKIDDCMVRCMNVWSLHRWMHPSLSTLNREEGLV